MVRQAGRAVDQGTIPLPAGLVRLLLIRYSQDLCVELRQVIGFNRNASESCLRPGRVNESQMEDWWWRASLFYVLCAWLTPDHRLRPGIHAHHIRAPGRATKAPCRNDVCDYLFKTWNRTIESERKTQKLRGFCQPDSLTAQLRGLFLSTCVPPAQLLPVRYGADGLGRAGPMAKDLSETAPLSVPFLWIATTRGCAYLDTHGRAQ